MSSPVWWRGYRVASRCHIWAGTRFCTTAATRCWRGYLNGANVYFVHSYYATPADDSCVIGRTEYGIAFPSVLARENLMATQFHPEKSGRWGIMLLRNFVQLAGEAA